MTTGAELAAALRRRASELGIPVIDFVRPLCGQNPTSWLRQLGIAGSPKSHTINRVKALLRGEALPAARNNSKNAARRSPHQLGVIDMAGRSPRLEDAPAPVDRDPCFSCGTRGDLACAHRRAA